MSRRANIMELPNPESNTQQSKPYRTKIKIKKAKKMIPEIQIKLDQMLSEAFSQINKEIGEDKQIKKDADIPILPNEIIREYISSVYDQYNLPDPISQPQTMFRSQSANPYQNVRKRLFQTPKKTIQRNLWKSKSSEKRNRSKTLEKILTMKKKFREELNSPIRQNDKENESMKPSNNQRLFPLKNKKRKQINFQQFLGIHSLKRRYCLVCQEIIHDEVINNHEKQCSKLQLLLKDRSLTIEKVIQILDEKLYKLNKQIKKDTQNLSGGLDKLVGKIKNVLTERNQADNIQECFLNLTVIKCWEKVDKLDWFQRMKMNAESKVLG